MTRTTTARIAGFTFLFYIAVGVMPVPNPHIRVVLTLLECFSALVLAVTLYSITRDQDRDIALLAMLCRVAEGVTGAIFIPLRLAALSLGTAAASAPDVSAAHALDALLKSARGWDPVVGGTFFAVGSTLFSWLLLRGRMIPVALAWLGVIASVILVVGLPLQLAGVITGRLTFIMWLPMLAFEVPLALWLLIKGVASTAS